MLVGLAAAGAAAVAACGGAPPPSSPPAASTEARLAEIEARFGGRLGLAAVDTGTGATVAHRGDERFLLCSTGKVAAVSATLARGIDQTMLVRYRPDQIEPGNSPTTARNVATGMTVAALCEAALTVSDNTAMNLLLELLGGPPALTAYVREAGDPITRFDRTEPTLNRTGPGDERDTTTPNAYARTVRALTLERPGRERLVGWMEASTTGAQTIRAGVPAGWRVADKTGSGAQGESNDVGVVWPPGRAPVVLAVYTSPADPKNTGGKAAIAAATTEALRAFGL